MKGGISTLKRFTVPIIAFIIILSFASSAMAATAYTRLNPGWGYTIIHQVEVKNPTDKPIYNIDLEVPLATDTNTTWQDFVAEEIYPKPYKIATNADGIRIAYYHIDVLPANNSKILKQAFGIKNYPISFIIDSSCCKNITKNVNSKYLKSEEGINISDPAIANYAKSVANGSTNPYIIAKKLFSDINLFMTYKDEADTEHSASLAIRSGKGNCVDYTFLYVACLRSLGIPARWHTGYTYAVDEHSKSPYLQDNGMLNGNLLRHTWAEFYLDGVGWVVADPTFTYTVNLNGVEEKFVDWSRFANIGKDNRLLWVSEGGEAVNDVKYTYFGNKPKLTFTSNIKLSMDISPYQDLAGHWAKDSVIYLNNLAPPIVVGLSSNYYGINEPITRAQFLTMINRVLRNSGSEVSKIDDNHLAYTDIPETHWAISEIKEALNRGYMIGYPDESFRPDAKITRGEMAAILARVIELPAASGADVFNDLNQTGYKWCKESIKQLYEAGLASGITLTQFAPQEYLTRGEAAVFITRWLTSSYYSY
ncbi:MAG: S-layer homology domain-containing protein [Clostridia bacterium]|nr:S-layer homology domain-containing protein [Clostridia bacterium]